MQRDGGERKAREGGREENELGLAFDVLIGRGVRTAAALRNLPGTAGLIAK